MKRRLGHAVLVLWVAAWGCGPTRIPPPATPAPAPQTPAAAIPGDLDVALRIDLGRMKSVLGSLSVSEIEKRTIGGETADETLLPQAISRSDTLWIALRPAARPELADNVIVLRGEFKGLDPHAFAASPRWQSAQDLGGGWRRYDREAVKARGAPARLWARGDDLMVFASSAEIDSVERQLEGGANDPHLEPSEKGVFSLSARAPALARYFENKAPTVSELLVQSDELELVADLDALGLTAELELDQPSEALAKHTAEGAAVLARSAAEGEGVLKQLAEGLSVQALGGKVVIRLSVPTNTLAALVGCLGGGSCG